MITRRDGRQTPTGGEFMAARSRRGFRAPGFTSAERAEIIASEQAARARFLDAMLGRARVPAMLDDDQAPVVARSGGAW